MLDVSLHGLVCIEREGERPVRVGESTGPLEKPVAKGVELLKASNAPADVLKQVGFGLANGKYIESAVGIMALVGAKIDAPLADLPFSVQVGDATKAAQAGADFLSKVASSVAA